MTRRSRQRLVVYGASGYTGRLVVTRASERGLDVALAGRSRARLTALSDLTGFPARVAAVDDPAALIAAFRDAAVVINCAGPFETTARPVLQACLGVGAHYFDVGGEPKVCIALHAFDEAAASAGVMVMPGAGFVMAASDFLAAHVVSRLPQTKYLRLALSQGSAISRGSFASLVELSDGSVMIRRSGKLVAVPAGSLHRRFDFGAGERVCAVVPWPDPFSAYLSTGAPNIEVYLESDLLTRSMLRASPLLAPFYRSASARAGFDLMTTFWPEGPSQTEREATPKIVVAEAEDIYRRRVVARLFTPNVYTFTKDCVVALAERVLAGDARPGYATPAAAYGADFVLRLPGVRREDAGAPRLP